MRAPDRVLPGAANSNQPWFPQASPLVACESHTSSLSLPVSSTPGGDGWCLR